MFKIFLKYQFYYPNFFIIRKILWSVDVDKIRDEFAQLHQEAVNLSIEAAYVTPENISQILSKAAQSARSVSVESGYMTDETKEQILQKADSQARSLAGQAKDYTPA